MNLQPPSGPGLYVHLPWCYRKCPYCDFNSWPLTGPLPEEPYVQALLDDLRVQLPGLEGRPLASVFFGGGTPSLFPPVAVGRIIDAAAGHGLLKDAEITLEANPGALEGGADLAGYAAAGVNRLSLGVQSFDDRVLAALGRIHDGAQARRAAAMARRLFPRLNLDLMHGCPAQEAAGFRADVEQALELDPGHLSTYQLTIEAGTAFGCHPPELPGEAEREAMEAWLWWRLDDAGYQRYEVSAQARPGHVCRHNHNYWRFGDYIGIGAGAHGKRTVAGQVQRACRPSQPGTYTAMAGQPPRWRAVTGAELMLEYLMNRLRLKEGFLVTDFEAATGLPAGQLDAGIGRALALGLLETGELRLRASSRGYRFLDDLLLCFVA